LLLKLDVKVVKKSREESATDKRILSIAITPRIWVLLSTMANVDMNSKKPGVCEKTAGERSDGSHLKEPQQLDARRQPFKGRDNTGKNVGNDQKVKSRSAVCRYLLVGLKYDTFEGPKRSRTREDLLILPISRSNRVSPIFDLMFCLRLDKSNYESSNIITKYRKEHTESTAPKPKLRSTEADLSDLVRRQWFESPAEIQVQ
jgi:hypothetical protein